MKKTHQWMLFFLFLFFLSTVTACTKKTEKLVFYQTNNDQRNDIAIRTEEASTSTIREIATETGMVEVRTTEMSAAEISPTQVSTPEMIAVYLCGQVYNPGVYILEAGSRLYQAVEMAGGLTDQAQAEAVNLARVLSDSEQIYIPDISEQVSIPMTEYLPSASTAASGEANGLDGVPVSSSSGNPLVININQASVEELMQLPGIGQVKAEAIVAYRSSNGLFASIEEIKNVPGIKEAAFEKIKGMIII